MMWAIYEMCMDNDWSVPVVTSSLVWREHSTKNGHSCKMGNCFVRNEIVTFDTVPSVSLLGLVVAFHALSFSWQCLALFKNPVQDFYVADMRRGRNGLRWLEYGLSAPLMIVVIAAVLSIIDAFVFVLLALCTMLLMLLGYMQEVLMMHTTLPHRAGWVLFFGNWTVLSMAFVQGIYTGDTPPPWSVVQYIVYVYVSMIILFGGFGIVQTWHVYHLNPRQVNKSIIKHVHFEKVELAYAALSLSSKFLLGALLTLLIKSRKQTFNLTLAA
jgi:hypothetical protein